jgi:phosphohistidine phosphatase
MNTSYDHTLIFVRHGIAEDPRWGMSDADRALTSEGIEKTTEIADFLVNLYPPDLIISSDYKRAIETAQLIGKAADIDDRKRRQTPALRPETTRSKWQQFFKDVLADLKPHRTIIAVGHEPSISDLIAMHLGADNLKPVVKKAGIAVIGMHDMSDGELIAFVPPKFVLRH